MESSRGLPQDNDKTRLYDILLEQAKRACSILESLHLSAKKFEKLRYGDFHRNHYNPTLKDNIKELFGWESGFLNTFYTIGHVVTQIKDLKQKGPYEEFYQEATNIKITLQNTLFFLEKLKDLAKQSRYEVRPLQKQDKLPQKRDEFDALQETYLDHFKKKVRELQEENNAVVDNLSKILNKEQDDKHSIEVKYALQNQKGPFYTYQMIIPSKEYDDLKTVHRKLEVKDVGRSFLSGKTVDTLVNLLDDIASVASDAAHAHGGAAISAGVLNDLKNADLESDLGALSELKEYVMNDKVLFKNNKEVHFSKGYLAMENESFNLPAEVQSFKQAGFAPQASPISTSNLSMDTVPAGFARVHVITTLPPNHIGLIDPRQLTNALYCDTSPNAKAIQKKLNHLYPHASNDFSFSKRIAKSLDREQDPKFIEKEKHLLNLIYQSLSMATITFVSKPKTKSYDEMRKILGVPLETLSVIKPSKEIPIFDLCKKMKNEGIVKIKKESNLSPDFFYYLNQKDNYFQKISPKDEAGIKLLNELTAKGKSPTREELFKLEAHTDYKHFDSETDEKLKKLLALAGQANQVSNKKDLGNEETALFFAYLAKEHANFEKTDKDNYETFLEGFEKRLTIFQGLLIKHNVNKMEEMIKSKETVFTPAISYGEINSQIGFLQNKEKEFINQISGKFNPLCQNAIMEYYHRKFSSIEDKINENEVAKKTCDNEKEEYTNYIELVDSIEQQVKTLEKLCQLDPNELYLVYIQTGKGVQKALEAHEAKTINKAYSNNALFGHPLKPADNIITPEVIKKNISK